MGRLRASHFFVTGACGQERTRGYSGRSTDERQGHDQIDTLMSRGVACCRVVGWREWVSLPELGIDAIKAKLDTGAKTSALHAWDLEFYEIDGLPWVRFCTYPFERDDDTVVRCAAPLADCRWVTNPGGKRERRCVITTMLGISGVSWGIELTLTNRDEMGFRMLVGREAMRGRLIVDPGRSFCTGGRARTPGQNLRSRTA